MGRMPVGIAVIGIGVAGSVFGLALSESRPTSAPAAGIARQQNAGRVESRSGKGFPQKFRSPPAVAVSTDSAAFRFVTEQPTVPIVEVSRRPPQPGPRFEKGSIVVAVFPALAGKQTRHNVRVAPLSPRTRYLYIVTIAGEGGPPITETGEFTTSIRMD
jgi:hypothetical protein